MRLLDHDEPIDPEIAASLDAIDAVLAGEPVDARYADLAEIALLVSAQRPAAAPEFAQSMDARVARRFNPVPAPAAVSRRRRSSRWFWQAGGALATTAAVVVAIVVLVGGHSSSSSLSSASEFSSAVATSTSASSGASKTPATSAGAASSGSRAAPANVPPAGSPSTSSAAPTLQPPSTGRKVVQSAQLNLTAPPNRIDDVAQQVYNVIGSVNGIVEDSTVTQGGVGGYAQFQLSIPNAWLGQAMSRLSSLNGAQVASRTDSTQDITDQYGRAQRALADARALRTSLLKQLAAATTTEEVDSLKAQVRDAEASISSDQATLNRLNQQVGFSQLSLQINARTVPTPVSHGSGGFGIGKAAHDAGRVLTVAAGVALITLAALTPIALVAALFWWVGSALRRRRREQALDAA
jgi:Domain of unknown function (DUF4349)